jgi:alpha-methylacyl-CoA racemase
VLVNKKDGIVDGMNMLAGVRVLDIGRLVAPAYASARLVDLGAEVTKIELAPAGDYLRVVPPLLDGTSVLHYELNRGKASLGLDWTNPGARDVLLRMVEQADVFIESTLDGGAERMGIGWPALQAVNPRLVYCSITSFGEQRPYARLRAHGLNIDAAAGIIPVTVAADGQPEISQVTHWVASQAAGLNAALGITAALVHRERGGAGQHVRVACWDAAVSFNYQSVVTQANLGTDFPYPSARDGFGPRYNSYLTADGRVVLLAAAEKKFWDKFCAVAGRPDLAADDRGFAYSGDPGSDTASGAESDTESDRLRQAIAGIIAARTAAEWIRLAIDHELPITPVHDAAELLDLDQTRQASMMSATTPAGQQGRRFRHVSSPIQVDDVPFTVESAAPAFGQDSARVLGAYGYRDAEVAGLVADGVVLISGPA